MLWPHIIYCRVMTLLDLIKLFANPHSLTIQAHPNIIGAATSFRFIWVSSRSTLQMPSSDPQCRDGSADHGAAL